MTIRFFLLLLCSLALWTSGVAAQQMTAALDDLLPPVQTQTEQQPPVQEEDSENSKDKDEDCLLYTSPSPRD